MERAWSAVLRRTRQQSEIIDTQMHRGDFFARPSSTEARA